MCVCVLGDARTEVILVDLPKAVAANTVVGIGAPRALVVRDANLRGGCREKERDVVCTNHVRDVLRRER